MMTTVARARALWEELADTSVRFPLEGIAVGVTQRSRMCPPGWTAIVALDRSAIAVAPSLQVAGMVAKSVSVGPDFDLPAIRKALPIEAELGPATLSYLDPSDFRPVPGDVVTRSAGAPDIADLLASVDEDEATESGLIDITSPAFAILSSGTVKAVAGYKLWPSAAHLCVLVAPDYRGRGLAQRVSSAAVSHALQCGLLVQWRARPAASRAVAEKLGFQYLGNQLSLHIGHTANVT